MLIKGVVIYVIVLDRTIQKSWNLPEKWLSGVKLVHSVWNRYICSCVYCV